MPFSLTGAPWRPTPLTSLRAAAASWFLIAVLGQLIFLAYVVLVYGGALLRQDLHGWNIVMRGGYIAGDTPGNAAIGAHLLLSVFIMLGGALQLLPSLRARAPRVHRWNGRLYLASAAIASVTGLYMTWFRPVVGDFTQHLGVSLNALLILVFGWLCLRTARAREFAAHRKWALRLFLAVSGVWFFRIGFMLWVGLHGGPVGFDPKTFSGPFLSTMSFAQYLVPLAILECYLRCLERGSAIARGLMSGFLLLLTLATAAGIALATLGMWLPRIH
ncbi:DUF2306 domain-containing protein [Massilia sp. TS11]|uniref:DUF2306 domain-containing protein n=1 Tax=Massilia sp. TS11 TaxID=2908003 RepID=UPI001EDB462E|nr:DUF2306 domain-containing protein [Massilia sp. TS11]MCG2584768.1 DUF2306 domain-containing protein [Massilia sp. TS11]